MSSSKSARRIATTSSPLQAALTELAETKAQLHETRISTEAMINSLGEGLIATNERGEITTVNQYAVDSLGFSEAELSGKWFPKAVAAVDQYLKPIDQVSRPVFRALTTGQAISENLYYLRKDGTAMPVFVIVSPILVNDQPVGAIEVFRDLTQEHQLDVAKEEFVSLASHQLRTPATGVMMILSMLAAGDFGPLTEQQHTYLQKAISNNNRQLQIIEDLLNAARVDAGRLELITQSADLADMVRAAVADQAAIVEAQGQTIELTAPRRLMASFDVQKLRMVIDNLISNASKYSAAGSTIRVVVRQLESTITLEVHDQGVGIEPDNIPRLFTKFTRLENELSASAGGTGLGLFLARSITELHRGSISVRSKLGQGSTFIVELPHQPGEPS